jgi:hypothetical protein
MLDLHLRHGIFKHRRSGLHHFAFVQFSHFSCQGFPYPTLTLKIPPPTLWPLLLTFMSDLRTPALELSTNLPWLSVPISRILAFWFWLEQVINTIYQRRFCDQENMKRIRHQICSHLFFQNLIYHSMQNFMLSCLITISSRSDNIEGDKRPKYYT